MLPHPKFKPRIKSHSKYVLLRGHEYNNVFWTTDDGSKHEGFDVLYRGNETKEMVAKWTDAYLNYLK